MVFMRVEHPVDTVPEKRSGRRKREGRTERGGERREGKEERLGEKRRDRRAWKGRRRGNPRVVEKLSYL